MLNLHDHLSFPQNLLAPILDKKYPSQIMISPDRSGLTRNQKSDSSADWDRHRLTLERDFQIYDPESEKIVVNWDMALKYRSWMDARYTLPALLRMRLALDPDYTIPRNVRRALITYETLIRRNGEILGSGGHTLLPRQELIKKMCEPLWKRDNEDPEDLEELHYNMESAEELISQLVQERYLEESGNYVYVPEYRNAEQELLEALSVPVPVAPEIWRGCPESLSSDQAQAAKTIICKPTVGAVLGGFPGSGKTYTCDYLRTEWADTGHSVLALTTTGAAALVLARQLHVPTYTISTIYCNRTNPRMQHLLHADVLIVDECSMLNMEFILQLLAIIRISKPVTILLTGDPLQLPPVGAGAVFSHVVNLPSPPFPVTLLTSQHRFHPDHVTALSVFNREIPWDVAAARPGYPTQELMYQHTDKRTIWEILEWCAQGAPLSGAPIPQQPDRVICTYRNTDAEICNTLIEGFRLNCPELQVVLTALARLYTTMRTFYDDILSFPSERVPAGKKLTPWFLDQYVTNRILRKKTGSRFGDELEKVENELTWALQVLTHTVADGKFSIGARLRCGKNGWFSLWHPKRNRAVQAEWGISCSKSIANGQIFYARADNLLYCPDTDTEIIITDPQKAAYVFQTAWVSSVHKTQGDSGSDAVFLLLSTSVENKLIYVAVSRGRGKNIIIQNMSTSTSWKYRGDGQILCKNSVSRLSTLGVV